MLKYNNDRGIQPIIPGLVNTQGVNIPLVTFESLVDTDFGLLLYIDKYFLDPAVFDVEIFNSHHKIRQMIWCLMNRDKWNPLYPFMNKNLKDSETIANQIYIDFMSDNKHLKKILEFSMFTNLCDFIKMAEMKGRDVVNTIVCQTEFEQEFVNKNIAQSTKVILYQELMKKGKTDEYQQFFFRHLEDPIVLSIILNGNGVGILDFIGINKTIYLADYKFNNIFNPDNIKEKSLLKELLTKPNQIKIYSPYDMVLYKEREEQNNG